MAVLKPRARPEKACGSHHVYIPSRRHPREECIVPEVCCAGHSELSLRLSCRRFRENKAQLHAMAIWSLTRLAEVAATGPMVRAIPAAIRRPRAPPECA